MINWFIKIVFILIGIVFGFVISTPILIFIKEVLPLLCLSGGDLGSCGGTLLLAQWGLAFLGGILGLILSDHFLKSKARNH